MISLRNLINESGRHEQVQSTGRYKGVNKDWFKEIYQGGMGGGQRFEQNSRIKFRMHFRANVQRIKGYSTSGLLDFLSACLLLVFCLPSDHEIACANLCLSSAIYYFLQKKLFTNEAKP